MTSEMPLSEALSKSHTGAAPSSSVPKSPALSLKTTNVAVAASRPGGGSGGQQQQQQQQQDTHQSPYLGPAAAAAASQAANGAPAGGMRDPALSADEPRYFPGVVTRGHRKDSGKRQDSMHESDGGGERKGRGRGGSEVKE